MVGIVGENLASCERNIRGLEGYSIYTTRKISNKCVYEEYTCLRLAEESEPPASVRPN